MILVYRTISGATKISQPRLLQRRELPAAVLSQDIPKLQRRQGQPLRSERGLQYLDFTTAYAFPAAGHWPTITTTAPVAIQAVNRFHVILRDQLTSSYFLAVDLFLGRPMNRCPRSRPPVDRRDCLFPLACTDTA